MSVLDKLAVNLGVRNNQPNKILAKEIVENNNSEAVSELVESLQSKNKRVASDCIKVLYEIGYIEPKMIKGYVQEFLNLLTSKNNRLVWGAMIALSTIAPLVPEKIFENFDAIKQAIETGSVITKDKSVKTLSLVASTKKEYNKHIFPYLLKLLKVSRSQSFPQYAESLSVAITNENRDEFIKILDERMGKLSQSQKKRVKNIYDKIRKN